MAAEPLELTPKDDRELLILAVNRINMVAEKLDRLSHSVTRTCDAADGLNVRLQKVELHQGLDRASVKDHEVRLQYIERGVPGVSLLGQWRQVLTLGIFAGGVAVGGIYGLERISNLLSRMTP